MLPRAVLAMLGDGHANNGSGHLQPGSRPEPEIFYIWGLNGSDRPPNPSNKVKGFALHLFGGVWKADRARLDPTYRRCSAPA